MGWLLRVALGLLVLCGSGAEAQKALPVGSPWVFAGFKANSEDGVYFAVSADGYHWKLVNGAKPVVTQTEKGELMRDPFLQRGPDGKFDMVWTWGWRDHTIGFSTSDDLVNWTAHRQLAVMANEPAALNVWAPAMYWEAKEKRWLIFWSSTIPGRSAGEDQGDGGLNHRIYSATTKDFEAFTPSKIYFDPGYSVIDATLLATPENKSAPYHLIFKDERKTPMRKILQTAEGRAMEGPWGGISVPLSEAWSEGAAIIRVPEGYLAYYDHYRAPQHYAAIFSPDLKSWTDASAKIEFPAGMRHGSFLQISKEEYARLVGMQ
jgi:hypothetical protein